MPRTFTGIIGLFACGIGACAGHPTRSCPAPASPSVQPESHGSGERRSGQIRRVLIITIDGLRPDSYLDPDEEGLKIPTLRWIVEHGAVSEGMTSVFPTLTYPAHTSIATGTSPGKHRIVSNRSFAPLQDDLEGWRWYADEVAVDPIWRVAQTQGLDTAMIHWPVSVGAAVRWLVPEYWRASNSQDQRLLRAVSTAGLLDQVAKEYPDFWSRFRPPVVKDDALTDIALHVLASGQPRLLMLHLVEVDGAQHRFGIDSPEAHLAIEKDDLQIARIVEQLKRSNALLETAIVVASDHGFRAVNRAVQPCTLLTDHGLITIHDSKIVDWKATVLANSGQAYVYVKDASDEKTRSEVQKLYLARQAQPNSGIERVYENREIRELGGDPDAFLALGAAEGYYFGTNCQGNYETEASYRATHGFDPRSKDMQASLLIFGPGIPHGAIQNARLIDIAPTVAEWLGLKLPAAEGKPIRVVPTR